MKIDELNIISFGKFKDKKITLSNGLNIIYGENETGKTTIHKFIEGMFFGFFKPYSKRKIYTDDYEKFFPWKYNKYCGVLKFEYKGELYRIERNFVKGFDDVKIYDDKTGEDVTNLFEYDPVLRLHCPNSRLLGFNSIVYNNTVSIKQLGSKTDDGLSKEVKDSLINIGGSLDEDISVKNAVEKLNKEMDFIGTASQRKSSPYGKTVEELNALLNERKEAVKYIKQIEEEKNCLNKMKQEMMKLEKYRKTLKKQLEAIERKEIKGKYEEAIKLSDEIENFKREIEDLKDCENLNLIDYTQLITLKKEKDGIEKNINDCNDEIKKIDKSIKNVFESMKKLEKFTNIDNDEFDDIVEDYKMLYNVKDKLEEIDREINEINRDDEKDNENMGDLVNDVYTYEEIEDKRNAILYKTEYTNTMFLKTRLDEKSKELKKKNLLIIVLWFLMAGSVFLGFKNNLFFIVAISFLVFNIYIIRLKSEIKNYIQKLNEQIKDSEDREEERNQQLKSLDKDMEEILNKYNCSNKIELKKLLNMNYEKSIKYKNIDESFENLNVEKNNLIEEIEKLKEKLSKYLFLLEGVVDFTLEDVNKLQKEYFEYIRLKNMKDKLLEEKNYLDDKLNSFNSKIDQISKEIEEIFARNSLSNVEEFEQGLKGKEKYETLKSNLENKELLLNNILGSRNLEYLKSKTLEVNDCFNDDFNVLEKEKLASELGKTEENINDMRYNIARVEERVENLVLNFRPLVEIEEDIDIVGKKKDEYEKRLESLKMARDTIEGISKNIQRDFAPVLNRQVSEIIKNITDGRYSEAKIDENLNISIVEPDTNTIVDIDKLSGGTIDQLYFAIRFGIANLVIEEGIPLILDDCFVQYDIKRLENILKFLENESKNRQIIMFTCHTRESELISKHNAKFNYIKL